MSPVSALASRLFERELLLFSLVIQRADGRVVVWPVKHHAADDLDAGAQGNRVSRKPAGSIHGAEDIFLAADKPDIERIPRDAARGARDHRQRGETRLVFVMAPQGRQRDI